MRRQYPIDVIMNMWGRINTSPWITLKCVYGRGGATLYFEMRHSKTPALQTIQFEARLIYMLADPWTRKYVLEQLTTALAALTRNTAEAGVGSLDVYREDYPA